MNYIQVKPLEGCPALAGIDLVSRWLGKPYAGLPRTRGDRPHIQVRPLEGLEAAPHSRG